MLRLHLPRAISLSVCLTAVACSNGTNKKKPIGNDASSYEGGADGNGAGGSDAGVDAPVEAAPEAAPEAQADAPMDSPSEPEAGLTCTAGTIKDYAQNVCRTCPSDGGVEGGADSGPPDGGADAGLDPYAPTLDCPGVLGGTLGSYDPTTGVLDIQIAYPLDIVKISISGELRNSSTGALVSGFSLPNMPITDNHVSLTIGTPSSGVDNILIDTLDMTDACGRLTSYDPGFTCADLEATPVEGGTTWAVGCVSVGC